MTTLSDTRKLPLTVSLFVGIAVAAVGVLLPGPALVHFLRPDPGLLLDKLLLGAVLFKLALVLLGVAVIVAGRGLDWQTPARPAPAPATGRVATASLLALLAIATVLRLYRLGEGLWYDEIITYVRYVTAPFGETVTTFDSQNQHFLFTLLAHAATQVFGDTAWALRLPSVLFGVASLGALYLLGREVADEREALLAVALLTFSYQHVWFSQNARGYMGLLFWTLLSSWLLVRGLRDGRPTTWLLYAVASTLGMYTHLTMIFVILGQALIYVGDAWRRWRGGRAVRWELGLVGFGGMSLLTFALYALVLPQFFGGAAQEESTVEAWKSPLWALLEIAHGMQLSFASGAIAVIALAIFGVGLLSYARRQPAIAVLLIVPSALCATLVIALGHHLWPRFFFFALGFAALIAVRGVVVSVQRLIAPLGLQRSLLLDTALCLALILVAGRSLPFVYGPKQDYEGALRYVEAARQPDDEVVTLGLAGDAYQILYRTGWPRVETLPELSATCAHAPRTWLIYTLSAEAQAVYPDILTRVQRDFTLQSQFPGTVGDGAIYVYHLGSRC